VLRSYRRLWSLHGGLEQDQRGNERAFHRGGAHPAAGVRATPTRGGPRGEIGGGWGTFSLEGGGGPAGGTVRSQYAHGHLRTGEWVRAPPIQVGKAISGPVSFRIGGSGPRARGPHKFPVKELKWAGPFDVFSLPTPDARGGDVRWFTYAFGETRHFESSHGGELRGRVSNIKNKRGTGRLRGGGEAGAKTAPGGGVARTPT